MRTGSVDRRSPLEVEGLINRELALPYLVDAKAAILHGNSERLLDLKD